MCYAICFSPSITCWEETFWPPFILVYRRTKGMDRWNSCCQCTVASGHYPIEGGSCPPFFFRVWLSYMKNSLQLFLLPPTTILITLALFNYIQSSDMALSRIRMPSFTLVITSGWHSPHGYPTALKFDPCASYTMLPAVIDLLVTKSAVFVCNHDANLYVL